MGGHPPRKITPTHAEGGVTLERETKLLEAINVLTEQIGAVQGQLGRLSDEFRRIREDMSELRQLIPSNPMAVARIGGLGVSSTGTNAALQQRNVSSLQGSSLETWCAPLLNGAANAKQ